MIAAPVSDEEAVRRTREYYVQRIDTARQKHENRVKGLDLVLRLEDGRKLEFRGRHYGVPPVPWPIATAKLVPLEMRLDALLQRTDDDAVAEWSDLCRDTTRVFNSLTQPEGNWIRRLFWRWWPSPARNCSIPEVVQLIRFFCECLKLDFGWPLVRSREPQPPSTSPSTSPPTPKPSRSGATKKAGRVVGSIS